MQEKIAKKMPAIPVLPKNRPDTKLTASIRSPKLRNTFDPKTAQLNDRFLTEKTAASNRFIKSPKSSYSQRTTTRSMFACPAKFDKNQSLSKSKVLVLKKLIPLEDKNEAKSDGSEFLEQIIYKDEEYVDSPSTLKLQELIEMSIRSGNKSIMQFKANPSDEEAVREEYACVQKPHLFGHATHKITLFADNPEETNQSDLENSLFSKTLFDQPVDSLPKSKFIYDRQIDDFDGLDEKHSAEKTKIAHRYQYNDGKLTENYGSQVFSKGLFSSIIDRKIHESECQKDNFNEAEPKIPQQRKTIDPSLFLKGKSKEMVLESYQDCIKKGNNNDSCQDFGYEPEPDRLFTKGKLRNKKQPIDYLLQSIDTMKTGFLTEKKMIRTNLLESEMAESTLQRPSKVYATRGYENKSLASKLHPLSRVIRDREFRESQASLSGLSRVGKNWRNSPKWDVSSFHIFQQSATRKDSENEKPQLSNQSAVTAALTQLNVQQNNSSFTGIAQFLLAIEVERLLHMMQAMFEAQSESNDEDTL